MSYVLKPCRFSEQYLQQYSRLLSETFNGKTDFSVDYLRWLYAENPLGQAHGFDAWWNDTLAAHYITIPVAYLINGAEHNGLLSLNTATSPQHQGKRLFTQLASATYEAAAEQGYSFVIGVANANSTPGFTRKLGFTLICPLEALVGIGNLLPTRPSQQGFVAKHSAAWLQWRLAKPNAPYFKCRNHFYSKTQYPWVHALLGVAHYPTHTFEGIHEHGASALKLWIGLNNQLTKKGIFMPIPKALRPSPLNLIIKPLQASFDLPQTSDICFNLWDFDAY